MEYLGLIYSCRVVSLPSRKTLQVEAPARVDLLFRAVWGSETGWEVCGLRAHGIQDSSCILSSDSKL